MNFTTLNIEILGGILFCSLNRPEKRNALNQVMLQELQVLCNSLEEGSKIRALVLRAEGKVFSAGADLEMMFDVAGKTEEELKNEAALFFECFEALYRLSLPTICFVHGGVHGGANGLVSACDFTLSDPETKFSFGEVRMGLVPATVAPFVLHRTGVMNARKLMLGGNVFTGPEAKDYGLIDIICPEADAEKKIRDLTDRILRNSPAAMRSTKKLLLGIAYHQDPSELKDLCTGLIAQTRLSDEAREGITAFFEKRNPSWESPGS